MITNTTGIAYGIIFIIILTFSLILYIIDRHIKIKRGLKEKPKSVGFVIPFLSFLIILCSIIVLLCFSINND